MDFDVLVASPDVMKDISKLGKVLGRKGLMPSPKAGTVVQDVSKAVKEFKAGKVEFKVDKQGIVHLPIGKASFTAGQIADNYRSIYNAIMRAKPSASKGTYVKSVFLSPTMGPAVKVDHNAVTEE